MGWVSNITDERTWGSSRSLSFTIIRLFINFIVIVIVLIFTFYLMLENLQKRNTPDCSVNMLCRENGRVHRLRKRVTITKATTTSCCWAVSRKNIRDFKIRDATGSKFSKRRHVAHAQAVVLVSPRRVENVGFASLTFCTKREYICSCA